MKSKQHNTCEEYKMEQMPHIAVWSIIFRFELEGSFYQDLLPYFWNPETGTSCPLSCAAVHITLCRQVPDAAPPHQHPVLLRALGGGRHPQPRLRRPLPRQPEDHGDSDVQGVTGGDT